MVADKKAPKAESRGPDWHERSALSHEEWRRGEVLKNKETRRILKGVAESVEDVAQPFWAALDRVMVVDQPPEAGKETRALIGRRVDKLRDDIKEVMPSEGVDKPLMVSEMRMVEDASHALRTPLTSLKGYLNLLNAEGGISDAQRDALLEKVRKNIPLARREFLDIYDLHRFGGLEGSFFSPDRPKGYSKERVRPVTTDRVEAILNNVVHYERAAGNDVVTPGDGREIDAVQERGSEGKHLRRALENVVGDTLEYSVAEGRLLIAVNRAKRTVTIIGEIKEKMRDESSALDKAMDHVRRRGWFRGRDIAATETDESAHGLGLKAAIAEAHLKFVGGELKQEVVDWDEAVESVPEWGEAEKKATGKVLKTTVRFA